ncbi:MAG: hypothetical protein ABSG07_03535 [Terriglobales bacterium]
MSHFSSGTHNQPEITTLFGPPKMPAGTDPPPPDQRFAITRKSLGKTLVILAIFPLLWSAYVGAYHYQHPPTLWTRTNATVLDGKIQMKRDICPPGWHPAIAAHAIAQCDFYVFRFGVSYLVAGAAHQSMIDSPLFTYKREAENWASQFTPGGQLAITYDPSDTGRVRRADDPPPGQYAAGPSIGYYPLGIGGPEVVVDSAAGPLKVAFCLLAPGILLLLSSRSERRDVPMSPFRG